jgi:hypothetical protein
VEGTALARDFNVVRHVGRTPSRITTTFLEFARQRLGPLTPA